MASPELKDRSTQTDETPVIEIRSPGQSLDDAALAQLGAILPDYVAQRRWFRAKTRTIQKAEIIDVLAIPATKSFILLLRLDYREGEPDTYLLTLALIEGAGAEAATRNQDALAKYRTESGEEGELHEALSKPELRAALLNAMACSGVFTGRRGDLVAIQTTAFRGKCDDADLRIESSVSRAEQSNTSIIYGDRFILKLFRKIEPGINPDVEIGALLTERGFANTPAVLGKLEYRSKDGETVYSAGILQEFVRNQGDAWKYTLDSLSGYFERALARGETAPALPTGHPLELMAHSLPDNARELFAEYLESARLLGQRTAEMHGALANDTGGGDFAPEPFTTEEGKKLYEEMIGQADITFGLLRRKQEMLADTAAETATQVLDLEHRVTESFSPLRDQKIDAVRIRFHGDYHLGQVLYTGSDFMIIDFEGEPARPLSERRSKTLAMRDVAGMIRSFQYAAYAALFGQVSGVPTKPETTSAVESWAAYWTAWISATYLRGYFDAAATADFVPSDAKERRRVFDAFLLQKALYEVAYELNNRPDWVGIPLRGILSLVS
jgi:maltose alpha-D-glucosyltransferase/alpha-amylase